MSLVKPFRGLRPVPARAAEVVAPPYDVVSETEARAQVAERPHSFLRVCRGEVNLPDATDPYDGRVYQSGASQFHKLLGQGIFCQDSVESFYLYRIQRAEHRQLGLVAAVSVTDYESGRIRRHELTHPNKEDDRVRHLKAVGAHTSPTLLTFRSSGEISALLERLSERAPDLAVTDIDGVGHEVWAFSEQQTKTEIESAFGALSILYIADGHHRSAAAARIAADMRRNEEVNRESASEYFLSVLFPHDQLRILEYNRVVRDLNGLSPSEFLQRVGQSFDIEKLDAVARPRQHGEIGMYLDRTWFRLLPLSVSETVDNPIEALDVQVLSRELLEPILGISDLRRDPRIDFVGGSRGLEDLVARVDSSEMAAAFALYPTAIDELMAVADANEFMPPKSTWFDPKLADGLIVYPFTDFPSASDCAGN